MNPGAGSMNPVMQPGQYRMGSPRGPMPRMMGQQGMMSSQQGMMGQGNYGQQQGMQMGQESMMHQGDMQQRMGYNNSMRMQQPMMMNPQSTQSQTPQDSSSLSTTSSMASSGVSTATTGSLSAASTSMETNTSTSEAMDGTPNPTPPSTSASSSQVSQQQTKEINTATICRIGQETVQEIVSRIQEVFSYLKSLHPPVGSNLQDRATLEKQQRLQEVMKGIAQLFKRLHVCWDKCQESTAGMEYTQIETLIPLKDDRDIKSELEKKRGDSYKQAHDEHTELLQQLTVKNRHLKEIIDQMRNIIWEINTMLAMRQT